MTFGEKVKAVRHKIFMSQEDMAKRLGVAFSTVNRWERGHHNNPTFKTQAEFDRLCKEHNIIFDNDGIRE